MYSDDKGHFVLDKTEWISPLLDVDLGEALRILSAIQLVRDLQLANVDFEMESKVVVDSIYGYTLGVSDFTSIINDRRHLISSWVY